MEGLTAFERALLAKLLAGDHPLLADLRDQVDGGRVVARTFTGVGFFTDLLPNPAARRATRAGFTLGDDIFGNIAGVERGAAFVLFVRDGLLSVLEGVTVDGPWPDQIEEFDLRYIGRPEIGRGAEDQDRLVEVRTDDGPRWLELPPR